MQTRRSDLFSNANVKNIFPVLQKEGNVSSFREALAANRIVNSPRNTADKIRERWNKDLSGTKIIQSSIMGPVKWSSLHES